MIYVDEWLEKRWDGGTADYDGLCGEAADFVMDEMRHFLLNCGFMKAALPQRSNAAEHLFLSLIHYERNRDMLKTCPHFRVLDLAVTVRWSVCWNGRDGSFLVTNEFAEYLEMTEEEVLQAAEAATRKRYPFLFEPLEVFLSRLEDREPPEQVCPFYLFRLLNIQYGAACLCFPEELAEIGRKIGSDYFLFPSSVDEWIVIPDTGTGPDPRGLREMLYDGNRTLVRPEEVLSDSVYRYRRESGKVEIA